MSNPILTKRGQTPDHINLSTLFFFFDEKAGPLLFIALRRNKGHKLQEKNREVFSSRSYINQVLRVARQVVELSYDQHQSNPWLQLESSRTGVLHCRMN